MAAGIIVIGFPAITEAYGYFVQYRLNLNWNQELSGQEQLAAVAEKKQLDQFGDRTVSSENSVLDQAVESIQAEKSAEFPATKIKIPKIGVDQVILDDVDVESLKNGPGHYRGSANPGQRGTVGIAGHRVTYTHPFNRLDELAPGDGIILETLDGIFEYRVVKSDTLEPSDLSALAPKSDGRARLTLTTCTPKYSARYRLDVQASLVKSTPRRKPTVLRRLVKKIVPDESSDIPQNILDLVVEQAQEAVSVSPENATARINLGIVYRNTGRHKDAITQLERAIALDPNNPEAYFQLASVYMKTEEHKKAVLVLKQAIELKPDFEPAYYRLGNLYLEANQPQEAVGTLTEALKLNPLSGDTHYYLGQAYEMLGDTDRAKEAYEKAVKYVPDYSEAKAALRRLNSL
jgi:LPXTG-site transpeptidase (sortase) family protein